MTLSTKVTTSHNIVKTHYDTEVGLLLKFIPIKSVNNVKIHYIILLDNSQSMANKLEEAIKLISDFLSTLPQESIISIYLFSNDIDRVYEGSPKKDIKINIKKGYSTNLHLALSRILQLVEKSENLVKILVISDGKPTDKKDIKDYISLQVPPHVQITTIGIGKDYNEKLLNAIADIGSGNFYHANDITDISSIFEKETIMDVAGYNIVLNLPENFKAVNYDNPVRIPYLDRETTIFIYGIVEPGLLPIQKSLTFTYYDPVYKTTLSVEKRITFYRDDNAEPSDPKTFAEVKFFKLLKEYVDSSQEGILSELKALANFIGDERLFELLKSLTNDKKHDLALVKQMMRAI